MSVTEVKITCYECGDCTQKEWNTTNNKFKKTCQQDTPFPFFRKETRVTSVQTASTSSPCILNFAQICCRRIAHVNICSELNINPKFEATLNCVIEVPRFLPWISLVALLLSQVQGLGQRASTIYRKSCEVTFNRSLNFYFVLWSQTWKDVLVCYGCRNKAAQTRHSAA